MMPEVSEVEFIVRELNVSLGGIQTVRDVEVSDVHRNVSGLTGLVGLDVSFGRWGKYILLKSSDEILGFVHLGMSGQLRLNPGFLKHTHVIFSLVDSFGVENRLVFVDPRRFGRVQVGCSFVEALDSKLGPDVLSSGFDVSFVKGVFAGSAVPVKKLLLDQRFFAGVGNYTADECLFLAGVDPLTAAGGVDADSIFVSLREVVGRSLSYGGASMRDYCHLDGSRGFFQDHFNVYNRASEPCLVCGSLILKRVLFGRSSFFCPSCQV